MKRKQHLGEYHLKALLCNACLSQNRNLYNLGNYMQIFVILCTNVQVKENSKIFLCWECISLLRNVKDFQEKVTKSHIVLSRISSKEQCLPTISFTNLNISEILTLDTFEEGQDINTTDSCTELEICNVEKETTSPDVNDIKLKIPKKECNIDNSMIHEENRTLSPFKVEIDDQKCIEIEDRKKVDRLKKRNYPKDRSQRYIMTYQSLKWEEAVQKIPINNIELKEWLKRERNSEHYQILKNKCDICLRKLKMDQNLRSHIKECHTSSECQPYACDICSVHYNSKPLLRTHIRRHYFICRCALCGYECYSPLHMRYHLRKAHQRSVECVECGACFKNTRDFYEHLRTHSAESYYICDQCGKRTRSLRFLERHIKRHHTIHRCEECDVTFKNYIQLSRHKKYRHARDPAELAFCVPCGKQFHTVHAYKTHLTNAAAHHAETRGKRAKEVACPVCLKVYSKNETMMNHYRWVHTQDSKYRCEQCGKAFLNRTKYKDHMQYFHMGLKKPKNKICKFCNKGFTTNQSLSYHILIHTGDKPHSCALCPQRFRQPTALRSHVRRAHRAACDDEIYVEVPYEDDT